MSKKKLSKLLALYLPYVVIGFVATNLGEAWRLAAGKELGDKIVSLIQYIKIRNFSIRKIACTCFLIRQGISFKYNFFN